MTNQEKINDLEQLFDFHTHMDNQGRASVIKDRIEKLRKLLTEEEILQESVRIAYVILNKNATDFEINQLAINIFKNELIEDTVNLIFVWNDRKELIKIK
jgi:hypothetical protein